MFCATPCTNIDSFDNSQRKHAYIVPVMITPAGSKDHKPTNKFLITTYNLKQILLHRGTNMMALVFAIKGKLITIYMEVAEQRIYLLFFMTGGKLLKKGIQKHRG